MTRIALVSLPRQDLHRPPAAIPILAAACEELGKEYEFFDFNLWLYHDLGKHWQEVDDNWVKIDSRFTDSECAAAYYHSQTRFVDQLLEYGCDTIAISVFTNWSAHCASELIAEINRRAERKNLCIIIGGTGIEARLPWRSQQKLADWMLQESMIDYYVYGEAEDLFRRLLQGDTIAPGINNFEYHQIDDLDRYAAPSYRKIQIDRYPHQGHPSLSINGSRGCVRKCTYCDVAKYWPKFRYKSGVKLAQELYSAYQETGILSFEFNDSLINGSIREFRAMNKELLRLKNIDHKFNIDYKGQFIIRSESQFRENDYAEMREAGGDYLFVGVETFSESVRYSMDKKFDNQALDFHLRMSGRYGIANILLMIVGYPTETINDHKINLDALKKYQKYSQSGVIKQITFGFTTAILEDTPLYRQKEMLEIVDEYQGDFYSVNNWVSLKNPSLDFHERVRRWAETVETADELGYQMTPMFAISKRLCQLLEQAKQYKKNPRLIQILSQKADNCV